MGTEDAKIVKVVPKLLSSYIVCCSVLQRVAVCCSVLQRVAVCCSVLQSSYICYVKNSIIDGGKECVYLTEAV